MTGKAQTTMAAIVIAGAMTFVAATASFPAHACSGQRIDSAAVTAPAGDSTAGTSPSKTEATASRDHTGAADGETAARRDAEQMRVLRDLVEARLRAFREKGSSGVQSTCM